MKVRGPQHVSSAFGSEGEGALRAARHFCLDTDGLEETRRCLLDAGYEPYDDTPIPNRPRFFCREPAGNLVEFTSIEGPYTRHGQ